MRVSELDDIEKRVLLGNVRADLITAAIRRAKTHLLDSMIDDRCECGGILYAAGEVTLQTSAEMVKASVATRCAYCQQCGQMTSVARLL